MTRYVTVDGSLLLKARSAILKTLLIPIDLADIFFRLKIESPLSLASTAINL